MLSCPTKCTLTLFSIFSHVYFIQEDKIWSFLIRDDQLPVEDGLFLLVLYS